MCCCVLLCVVYCMLFVDVCCCGVRLLVFVVCFRWSLFLQFAVRSLLLFVRVFLGLLAI